MSFLRKIVKGELGWKTVSGAALIAVSAVLQGFGVIEPGQADGLLRAGEALGIVGLRDAVAKLKES